MVFFAYHNGFSIRFSFHDFLFFCHSGCRFLDISNVFHSVSSFTTPQDPSCLRGAVTHSKSLPLEEETYSAPSGACTLGYNDPSEGHCGCLRCCGERSAWLCSDSLCGTCLCSTAKRLRGQR